MLWDSELHFQVEKKRKNQERKEAQKMLELQNAESDIVRVLVRNSATGEVLTGLFVKNKIVLFAYV